MGRVDLDALGVADEHGDHAVLVADAGDVVAQAHRALAVTASTSGQCFLQVQDVQQ
jgi:aminoglycoside phosphotransferase